ncbi:uncharacterized protein LOC103694460 isoform X4 [Rattus norvegicus]|uniref:uncharacterized protein LOC103694460 isoform X4 n=1 Tax=Rattus norvegicus TaxID=10116 RepID=UPI0019173288|nr:uncharacterized protein LOC103694460 isoform X4 [Rattus norvegicus]
MAATSTSQTPWRSQDPRPPGPAVASTPGSLRTGPMIPTEEEEEEVSAWDWAKMWTLGQGPAPSPAPSPAPRTRTGRASEEVATRTNQGPGSRRQCEKDVALTSARLPDDDVAAPGCGMGAGGVGSWDLRLRQDGCRPGESGDFLFWLCLGSSDPGVGIKRRHGPSHGSVCVCDEAIRVGLVIASAGRGRAWSASALTELPRMQCAAHRKLGEEEEHSAGASALSRERKGPQQGLGKQSSDQRLPGPPFRACPITASNSG